MTELNLAFKPSEVVPRPFMRVVHSDDNSITVLIRRENLELKPSQLAGVSLYVLARKGWKLYPPRTKLGVVTEVHPVSKRGLSITVDRWAE